MSAPIDITEVDLVRRQGDVSGTLIYVAPNGLPANIGGWTFTFSVQLGNNLKTVSWVPVIANPSGLPMTTVASPGFTIPNFNSVITVPVVSSTGMVPGDYLYIPGLGVIQVQTVPDPSHLMLYNSGFPGNSASGTISAGVNVFEAPNAGYTVLVIPSTITDWNSGVALTPSRSVGRFQYYLKYTTTDFPPGPFKKTFYQGFLYIQPQNDPTA